jgi:hypothetical protein
MCLSVFLTYCTHLINSASLYSNITPYNQNLAENKEIKHIIYGPLVTQAAAAAWEHHTRISREHSANTIIPISESLQNKTNAARDLVEREVSAFQRSPDNRLYMMPASSKVLVFHSRYVYVDLVSVLVPLAQRCNWLIKQ